MNTLEPARRFIRVLRENGTGKEWLADGVALVTVVILILIVGIILAA